MSILSTLIMVSLLAIAGLAAPTTPPPTPAIWDGELTDGDRENILDRINGFRSEVATGDAPTTNPAPGTLPGTRNMNKLFWNGCLSSIAQGFADVCDNTPERVAVPSLYISPASPPSCAPSPSYGGRRFDLQPAPPPASSGGYPPVGETMFASKSELVGFDPSIILAIDTIKNQTQDWRYGKACHMAPPSCAPLPSGDRDDCDGADCKGGMTMLRGETRYVGCGIKRCPTPFPTPYNSRSKWWMLCLWFPGGVVRDEWPYELDVQGYGCKITEETHTCDPDRSVCGTDDPEAGLCSGGMVTDCWLNPVYPDTDPTPCPSTPAPTMMICDDGTVGEDGQSGRAQTCPS